MVEALMVAGELARRRKGRYPLREVAECHTRVFNKVAHKLRTPRRQSRTRT